MVVLVAKSCPTLATSWTVTRQAPLFMGFSRQEYWSGLPFHSPGDLLDPGVKPGSPALQADDLLTELWGKPISHFNKFFKSQGKFNSKSSLIGRIILYLPLNYALSNKAPWRLFLIMEDYMIQATYPKRASRKACLLERVDKTVKVKTWRRTESRELSPAFGKSSRVAEKRVFHILTAMQGWVTGFNMTNNEWV